MDATLKTILTVLSDGRFHSGEVLGRQLGLSKAAVWKQIRKLARYDLAVHAVNGKGYRLERPLEMLDGESIAAKLGESDSTRPAQFDLLLEAHSTNEVLARRLAQGSIHRHVCLAEFQSAGRGRAGRRWSAPLASGICLSLGWRVCARVGLIMGLSMAVAVTLVRLLKSEFGVHDIGVKWPNDVLCGGAKLAGVLSEVRGEVGGSYHAVIGVGLNVQAGPCSSVGFDQPWTTLSRVASARPSREVVAIALISALFQALPEFEARGFASFREQWREYDLFRGHVVRLRLPTGGVIMGHARDVDVDGALLLSVGGYLRRYHNGEVSLRLAG
jgi:BirA family transcriptional regulator, biotin operon repressor / biotin---[acetyl-CoA-carboxylase] ligase